MQLSCPADPRNFANTSLSSATIPALAHAARNTVTALPISSSRPQNRSITSRHRSCEDIAVCVWRPSTPAWAAGGVCVDEGRSKDRPSAECGGVEGGHQRERRQRCSVAEETRGRKKTRPRHRYIARAEVFYIQARGQIKIHISFIKYSPFSENDHVLPNNDLNKYSDLKMLLSKINKFWCVS